MMLQVLLAISAVLFCFGLLAALTRSNAIMVLIGIEMMLGAGNLNFIAFWKFSAHPELLTGVMFAIFSIALAAAEAAVGLAIIIQVHRRLRSVNINRADQLKG
ncbi:MAG: NADH-quinone oxidoreductase subunit NuoK [Verrucomicrobiota bacterium]